MCPPWVCPEKDKSDASRPQGRGAKPLSRKGLRFERDDFGLAEIYRKDLVPEFIGD